MFETFEEFIQWLNVIPDEEKEPFCPFEMGYCDVAYTNECFKCQGKDLRFNEDAYFYLKLYQHLIEENKNK